VEEQVMATAQPGLTVNGRPESLAGATPHTTVLDWLRDRGLTGAKEGCAEGECGACSIMVARPGLCDPSRTDWTAINACLVPAAGLDGQEIVTAEGLGRPDALHPVQREMADRGGSQCGYCTPGFICSMAAEFYRRDRAPIQGTQDTADDGEHGANGFDLHALSGNLCRCTGYRPIKDAAYALGEAPGDDPFVVRREQPAPAAAATRISADGAEFVRPSDLAEALQVLAAHP
jgi:xanthine dehydrogenase small subunit